MPKKKSFLTVTDQFCGAGGSSLGAASIPDLNVYLAMNHWALAIETHNTNFPQTYHDLADVSAVDPRRYPSTDIMITSPECTNHSVAKGARRRRKQMHLWEKEVIDPSAERSRATMWDVPRFAEWHDYNIIVTENVVDARQWIMWDSWIHAMDSLGYDHHIVYFNSMFSHIDPRNIQNPHDFAPQSRDRMYVVFWKKGNTPPDLDFRPHAYCPTCDKEIGAVQVFKQTKTVRQLGGRWGRYGDQYVYMCPTCANIVEPYYFAAFNAVDWSLEAERIGDRKRPLKKKTLDRIKKGLEKFGDQYLVIDLAYTHAKNNRADSITQPLPTQTTAQTHALVMHYLINTLHGDGTTPVSDPLATQTTRQSHALVTAFLTSTNYYDDRNIPLADPMGTQTTQDKFGITYDPFMIEFRNNQDARGLDKAMSTIMTSGSHHGVVMPAPFLVSYYGSNGNLRTVDDSLGTIPTNDRHALVQMPFFLGYANSNSSPHPISDPLLTVHTENGHGLMARQAPIVEDCYFRMLQPHEIGRGMAFPKSYVVLGTKREQVKQYGNAVTPPVMRMILERCVATFQ